MFSMLRKKWILEIFQRESDSGGFLAKLNWQRYTCDEEIKQGAGMYLPKTTISTKYYTNLFFTLFVYSIIKCPTQICPVLVLLVRWIWSSRLPHNSNFLAHHPPPARLPRRHHHAVLLSRASQNLPSSKSPSPRRRLTTSSRAGRHGWSRNPRRRPGPTCGNTLVGCNWLMVDSVGTSLPAWAAWWCTCTGEEELRNNHR